MKKLLCKLLSRRKGNIENIIYSLICITTCFVIITMGINYMGVVKGYLDANLIARKYLLKMETAGYLDPAVSKELVNELKGKGFESIGIYGTTAVKSNFGDDIYLNISFLQKYNSIKITGFNFDKKSSYTLIRIAISSTAKG